MDDEKTLNDVINVIFESLEDAKSTKSRRPCFSEKWIRDNRRAQKLRINKSPNKERVNNEKKIIQSDLINESLQQCSLWN